MLSRAISNLCPRVLAVALVITATPAGAAVIGQIDDFEDGTTQGWAVGLGGMGTSPVPPFTIADGGPQGVGDGFMVLQSVGGSTAGNRLVAINVGQWAGNYTGLGLTQIAMDLNNFGTSDLSIRLLLENPQAARPVDAAATTDAFFLPAGSGWMHATFHVDAGSLTSLSGSIDTLLSGVTALRVYHSTGGPPVTFPGPSVVAALGVDNITAVPLPGAGGLAIAAACAALGFGRRRTRG